MVSQNINSSEDSTKSAETNLGPAGEKQSSAVNTDVLDSKGRVYATGKRKTAKARVWLKPSGKGHFLINGSSSEKVFSSPRLASILRKPFESADRSDLYDVICTTKGGGFSAQAQAVVHGISVALQLYEPGLRPVLKSLGLLTRDARRVERKKPGLRKARRKRQFSKR
jgi:small subunit ribosomal protein S9